MDGSKTNFALLDSNIKEARNNPDMLSLGNPMAFNTMNSSQWQGLLKTGEKSPEKTDWTKATVLNPSGPQFGSFLNAAQGAVRESIDSVVQH